MTGTRASEQRLCNIRGNLHECTEKLQIFVVTIDKDQSVVTIDKEQIYKDQIDRLSWAN